MVRKIVLTWRLFNLYCIKTKAVISWEFALALIMAAFILPCIVLYFRMETQQQRRRHDITEKECLRRMLRETETHVRNDKSLFLEALGVPFLLMRASGRVVMGNQPAGGLLGMDVACCPNLLKLLPPCELKTVIEELLAAQRQETRTLSLTVQGEPRHYVLTATPLHNADHHIGVVFHDVTEEYRTQVIRRDFVANASHELRTPLTILRGYLETLLENPQDSQDEVYRTRALQVMRKHTERITHLVEGMLTVSRLEGGGSPQLRCEEFDFSELVADVALQLESLMQQGKVDFAVRLHCTPFMVNGDKFYWSQIIFNLLENSLKNNMSPGLQLEVGSVAEPDGGVRIYVQDNGVGIDAEHLPYIFKRFYRADATGKVKGTGLGLSIVRHAVEAHGGSITASSTPGVSTTFTICLPRQ